MSSARARAERCFAVARSTTFAGEREAAIARGLAICAKDQLNLDTFDIPGRARSAQTERLRGVFAAVAIDGNVYSPRFYEPGQGPTFYQPGDRAPEHYDRAAVQSAMARFHATMAAAEADCADIAQTRRRAERVLVEEAADAGSGFAAAFEAGARAAALRKAGVRQARLAEQGARWPDIAACASFVFSRGVPVYETGADPLDDEPRWYAPGRDPERFDDWGLRDLADAVTE